MPQLNAFKSLLAFAVVLFAVLACNQTSEPVTLKSADGKFQLTAPTGWKLSGSSGETNEIINAEHTKLDLAILVTAKAKADLGDLTLAEFTETGRRGQGKNSVNSLSAPESLTVNGYQARQYELKRDKVTCLVTAIESPAHFHWITACGANVIYPENKPTLNDISSSFRAL